jgi:hypothetical protein
MNFWKPAVQKDEDKDAEAKPSFLNNCRDYIAEEATDYAKSKVAGAAISFLSGGAIPSEFGEDIVDSFEDEDEDEVDSSKNLTFQERLERELAKIAPQNVAAGQAEQSGVTSPETASSQELQAAPEPTAAQMHEPYENGPATQTYAPSDTPPEYTPAPRPMQSRPQGFGRKGL